MATNEPNKSDEVKTIPAQEVKAEEKAAPAKPPEVGGEAPAPKKPAEKAASQNIVKGGLEPPTPVDIPDPGDLVVSFDKINEIVSGKQAAKEAEQAATESPQPEKSGPVDKKAEPEKHSPNKAKGDGSKTADSKPKSHQPKAAEKADKKPSRPVKSSRLESAAVQFQENPPNSPSRKRRP